MVYCTLQEAWGSNFPNKKKKKHTNNDKRIKKEVETFISTNDNLSKDRYRYDFSRTDSPLKSHNGNKNRIKIDDNYTIGDEVYNENTYSEELDNKINPEEEDITNIHEDLESEENDFDENFKSDENSNSINILINKINDLIIKIDNQEGNSLNDIVMYVLLGLFIIFILDMFVKIGKNSN